MKATGIAVGVVVAALLVIVIVWRTSIDLIVARAIEHYGSEVLGTSVRVGSVTIDTREGSGVIQGLRVAQPEGFGDGDVITVEEIALDLDTASLMSRDPLALERVRVHMPRVFFVLRSDRSNNLTKLQENVAAYAAASGPAPAAPEAGGDEPRIRLDTLEIEGGRLQADLSQMKLGVANASLPPLRLAEVGGARGKPPGELGEEVAQQFISNSLRTVAQSTIGKRLRQLTDETAGQVRGMLEALFPR